MMKVAVYARISSDPSGQALGVGRQEELCRPLPPLPEGAH